jgi:hypothetical protein
MRTVVDQRADLYSLGVILWQAATGTLPFGEGPALLRERVALPPVTALRPDAPPVLEPLLSRCLAEQPEDRPDSAAEIAWVLRGGARDGLVVVGQTVCQHCGAPLRLGQRLCLGCGRLGVRFAHRSEDQGQGWALELTSLREDASLLADLRQWVQSIAQAPQRPDEFVIGDVSLYADHELVARKRLPARLFDNLDEPTAEALREQASQLGLDVRVIRPNLARAWGRAGAVSGLLAFAVISLVVQYGIAPSWVIGTGVTLVVLLTVVFLSKASTAAAERRIRPLYHLREQPAALPASDPLVARLAALLDATSAGPTPPDVRAQLGELALLVQRVVDRRAELTGLHEAREFQLLTGPIAPLLTEIEARVRELARCDRELAELDEATMVRALAAVDVRTADPGKRELERKRLLDGLDRLRSLEDRRTATFHGRLEASTLLRRAADLGLGVHDGAAEQARHVQLALAALGGAD